MKKEYKEILEDYGYNVKSQGFIYFEDLIEDVKQLLKEGKSDDEIRELLPRYELEYYHFFYEVGRKQYTNDLTKFCESALISDKKVKFKGDVYSTILFFSKKFNELDENLNNKVIVKKKSVM